MTEYLFTFQSMTQAQSSLSVLKQHGIAAELGRTPKQIASRGCGYTVSVGEQAVRAAASALRSSGRGYVRLYRQRNGAVEEVAL